MSERGEKETVVMLFVTRDFGIISILSNQIKKNSTLDSLLQIRILIFLLLVYSLKHHLQWMQICFRNLRQIPYFCTVACIYILFLSRTLTFIKSIIDKRRE